MITWHAIETAPRDGRTVLLYRYVDPWHVIGYGYWQDIRGLSGWLSVGFHDPPGNLGLAHPTHWAALTPPEPEAQPNENWTGTT